MERELAARSGRFEQHTPVAAVRSEVSARTDRGSPEQRKQCPPGWPETGGNERHTEVEEPGRRPPGDVWLPVNDGNHAERGNEESALNPDANTREDADWQDIQEHALDRKQSEEGETAGGRNGRKVSKDDQDAGGGLLVAAHRSGGKQDGPGQGQGQNICAEENCDRGEFGSEDFGGADGQAGESETIPAVGEERIPQQKRDQRGDGQSETNEQHLVVLHRLAIGSAGRQRIENAVPLTVDLEDHDTDRHQRRENADGEFLPIAAGGDFDPFKNAGEEMADEHFHPATISMMRDATASVSPACVTCANTPSREDSESRLRN